MISCTEANPSALFHEEWKLTTGPLVIISVFFAQFFPSESTAGVSSKRFTVTNNSSSSTYTAVSSFVHTPPLAAITITGVLETPKVSNSEEFCPFLSACALMLQNLPQILFPTDLCQGWRWDEGRLFRSLVLQGNFWPIFTHLRGRMALAFFVSSWDLSSTFGAYGLRSWGVVVVIQSDRPFFFPNPNVTQRVQRELHFAGFRTCSLPKGRTWSRRPYTLEYTQLTWILQSSNSTVVSIPSRFFVALPFNLLLLENTCRRICIPMVSCNSDFREDAKNHTMVSCTYPWGCLGTVF